MSAARIISLVALTAFAGCCTRYSVAPEHMKGMRCSEGGGEFVEHYHVKNYGWYLFNAIPVICGDVDPDAKVPFAFFSDQVRTDLMTELFNDRVRETGTKPICVATLNTDFVTFQIPWVSFPLFLPYVICYHEVQISGVLVKKEGR